MLDAPRGDLSSVIPFAGRSRFKALRFAPHPEEMDEREGRNLIFLLHAECLIILEFHKII